MMMLPSSAIEQDRGHKDDPDPIELITFPDSVSDVKTALEETGYSLSYEMSYIPSNSLKVEGAEASKLFKLLDILEDNDDVQEVYDNSDIDEAEMESLADQICADMNCPFRIHLSDNNCYPSRNYPSPDSCSLRSTVIKNRRIYSERFGRRLLRL
jgi:hypothetical protein